MSSPAVPDRQLVVVADLETLTAHIAARLLTALVDAQASRGAASVVLTGGGVGLGALAAVAASPARDAVDWTAVEVWWGDERFVPGDSAERNEVGARRALLDGLPLDPARVHAMGSTDDFQTPEQAARDYADQLAHAAGGSAAAGGEVSGAPAAVPRFDVLLLGMGPEGHVASLFPESPALHETGSTCAVHDCPKPPLTRVSLTLPAIGAAREVWLIVSGQQKAAAVARVMAGAGPFQVPAAGARGTEATRLLLDRAAGGALPS